MSRIVVADASPAVAGALRGFLESRYEVRAARDEDETLEAVRSFGADLLIASRVRPLRCRGGLRGAEGPRPRTSPSSWSTPPRRATPTAGALRAGAEACLRGRSSGHGPQLRPQRARPHRAPGEGAHGSARVRHARGRRGARSRAATTSRSLPERGVGPTQAAGLRAFRSLLAREVKRSPPLPLPGRLHRPGLRRLRHRDAASWRPPTCSALLARRQGHPRPAPARDRPGLGLPSRKLGGVPAAHARGRGDGGGRAAAREAHRTAGDVPRASAGVSAHVPTEGTGRSRFGKLFRDATDALAQARSEGGPGHCWPRGRPRARRDGGGRTALFIA